MLGRRRISLCYLSIVLLADSLTMKNMDFAPNFSALLSLLLQILQKVTED